MDIASDSKKGWIGGLVAAIVLAVLNEIYQKFLKLDSSMFSPHGMCLLWHRDIILTEAASNGIIAISYLIIPLQLLASYSKKNVLVFTRESNSRYKLTVWFAAFIVSCGATHVMDIVTLWAHPYWLDAIIRCVTAISSAGAAVALGFSLRDQRTMELIEEIQRIEKKSGGT